jgi:putative PIN family toxin of toxin-antitoxin system
VLDGREFDFDKVSYTIPRVFRAVLDTNVIVAALRSSSGASFQILLAADRGEFELALSVPLLAEYDDVTQRPESGIEIDLTEIDAIIRRLAAIAYKQPIYYLWRPVLPDPKDDMVLELALAATASHIVTFNKKHLRRAEEYGIKVSSPAEFLEELS